jgi:hypothetical protein
VRAAESFASFSFRCTQGDAGFSCVVAFLPWKAAGTLASLGLVEKSLVACGLSDANSTESATALRSLFGGAGDVDVNVFSASPDLWQHA